MYKILFVEFFISFIFCLTTFSVKLILSEIIKTKMILFLRKAGEQWRLRQKFI